MLAIMGRIESKMRIYSMPAFSLVNEPTIAQVQHDCGLLLWQIPKSALCHWKNASENLSSPSPDVATIVDDGIHRLSGVEIMIGLTRCSQLESSLLEG